MNSSGEVGTSLIVFTALIMLGELVSLVTPGFTLLLNSGQLGQHLLAAGVICLGGCAIIAVRAKQTNGRQWRFRIASAPGWAFLSSGIAYAASALLFILFADGSGSSTVVARVSIGLTVGLLMMAGFWVWWAQRRV